MLCTCQVNIWDALIRCLLSLFHHTPQLYYIKIISKKFSPSWAHFRLTQRPGQKLGWSLIIPLIISQLLMSLMPIELISNLHVAQKKGKKQPQQETTQKHTRDELYKFSPKHKTVWKFSIQFYPISSKKSLSKTTMTTD